MKFSRSFLTFHVSLEKNSIFAQNLDFWTKFRFLTKISIFAQNLDFWTKFRFLTKMSIFDQHFDFWPKCRFLTKISIFYQNFDFWLNVLFLATNFCKILKENWLVYAIFQLWKSKSFSVKPVTGHGTQTGVGNLAAGFSLTLNANEIIIGEMMHVSVTWALTLPDIEFYFRDCAVEQGASSVSVIKDGCFSEALKESLKFQVRFLASMVNYKIGLLVKLVNWKNWSIGKIW